MNRFYAYFKPEYFYPVPVGTILRYAGHDYNYDTKRYDVIMDVIGEAPKESVFPEVVFVRDELHIPNINEQETPPN